MSEWDLALVRLKAILTVFVLDDEKWREAKDALDTISSERDSLRNQRDQTRQDELRLTGDVERLKDTAEEWREKWFAVGVRAELAEADPALLRPLGGDLYAVEAVWDLTDLEKFVLSGRRA